MNINTRMLLFLGLKSMQDYQAELLAKIQEGEEYEGTIKAIEKYGAVVDLGDIDGLLPTREISWTHIKDPHEVLKIKQSVTVKVLRVDKEQMHISLGLKQLTENPWDRIGDIYPIDTIHKGTVSWVENFGCFVDLQNGFSGFVPASEMDWLKPKPDPTNIVSIGDEVKVQVLNFDSEQMHITLSLKKLTDDLWKEVSEKCKINTIYKGTVSAIKEFGCFVHLANGFEGLVHKSQMDWFDHNPEVSSIVSVGEEIQVVVQKIDFENRKIALGMKQCLEYPWDNAEKMCPRGSIHAGTVSKLEDYGFFVKLENGLRGLVQNSEMDRFNSRQSTTRIASVGDKVKVRVFSCNNQQRRMSLSMVQMPDVSWDRVGTMCAIGSIHKGTVMKVEGSHCLVKLENGFEGTVQNSEMDWLNPKPEVSSIVSVGHKIQVKVIDLDIENEQVSLGIKQCKKNPWELFANKYNRGDKLTGKVQSIKDFGITVELEYKLKGIVPNKDISWTQTEEQATKGYSQDEIIDVMLFGVDVNLERISLGIKQLTPESV